MVGVVESLSTNWGQEVDEFLVLVRLLLLDTSSSVAVDDDDGDPGVDNDPSLLLLLHVLAVISDVVLVLLLVVSVSFNVSCCCHCCCCIGGTSSFELIAHSYAFAFWRHALRLLDLGVAGNEDSNDVENDCLLALLLLFVVVGRKGGRT